MWTCTKCGMQNSYGSNYCANCGKAKTKSNNLGYIILAAIIVVLIVAIIVLATNSRGSQTTYTTSQPIQQSPTVSSLPNLIQQSPSDSSASNLIQQSAPVYSTPTLSDSSSGAPSYRDIDNIGADVEYPNSSDYLHAYETMYVSANSKGGIVYALHGLNDGGSWKSLAHEVADGTKVKVIAKHSFSDSTGFYTYACCIYSANGNQRAGWINMEHLSDYN